MAFITTNDGVKLYYEIHGEGKPLLMLPGWTCTTAFWKKNVEALSRSCKLILMDMRGHGRSDKPERGHRISRYAMDVKNLLDALGFTDVAALGWSMGASVLWSYIELFGGDRFGKLICVDQSPSQYTGPDWVWGQNGCYDAEMFIRVSYDTKYDPRGSAERLVYNCLYGKPSAEDVQYLADAISQCPADIRIAIMRDHTNLDWRDLLPSIKIPTLVCVARKSTVFDWRGSAYVGEKIPGARTEFFEEAGHMLFWEEPEHFNRVVADFVNGD